ncbi:zinc-binding alcohol dehydrogenase family protein [Tistlia consotensis]|uniref:Zinc-type alcohol dehydrogenase-like protein n=1 Tax=Tistlia consotensis USBA 355 TaxID=560819 RepID=A0A1Y6BKH0_9PROT|nr:zinc-binding alcohol dehydrogenase family protein [Tistlia consotensis]SMF14035.1 zinc-binding alcohol dehydrogenase family protein [Tistlia consotensis USBA 355]SNR49951.1 zinc-binding alcohol dehydrogenase family protein [Tistlia consotensis]
MKAVGYRQSKPIAEPDSLIDLTLPEPTPGPRDLLVRVQAVSVNPVDTKMRLRAQPAEGEVQVLGWDAAGTVEAVGSEVTLFRPGDAVFYAGAIDRPGSDSELHLVDERIVGRKPACLDFAEAAALPLTAITAWELLFERLAVPYGVKTGGGSLLVIGGAGGVGSILIQLASRLTGLTVIATASRPETADWVRRMGAHHVVDHRRPLDEALADVGLGPVEHVAGLTATEQHLPAIAKLIAPQGGLAVIDDPKAFDILPFKRKSVRIAWEFMFTRSLFGTADMIEQHRLLSEVSALVEAGVLRSTLTETAGPVDAATLRRVHALVESGKAIGKTVLAGF